MEMRQFRIINILKFSDLNKIDADTDLFAALILIRFLNDF